MPMLPILKTEVDESERESAKYLLYVLCTVASIFFFQMGGAFSEDVTGAAKASET